MMNMAALGAMLAGRPVLSLDVVKKALVEHFPAGKQHLVEANLKVIEHGSLISQPSNS